MTIPDIPFDLVEVVQDINDEYFIIDTLEKDAFMVLPASIEAIFSACHCAQYGGSYFDNKYALILDILNELQAFGLCKEHTSDFWILTEKGRLLQQQIIEITHPSRLMR